MFKLISNISIPKVQKSFSASRDEALGAYQAGVFEALYGKLKEFKVMIIILKRLFHYFDTIAELQ